MIQRCLKIICLSRGTEITNRNGLLYFKRKLPEKVRVWTKNLPTCSRDEFWSAPEDEMVHSGDRFPVLEATHDHYMTEILSQRFAR